MRKANPDSDSVGRAAGILQVSEFEIFELAHSLWFGKSASSEQTEDLFSGYMHRGLVPYWVRDMARKVIARCGGGMCDPEEFGVHVPEPDPETKTIGKLYIIMVTVIMIGFCYVVTTVQYPEIYSRMF